MSINEEASTDFDLVFHFWWCRHVGSSWFQNKEPKEESHFPLNVTLQQDPLYSVQQWLAIFPTIAQNITLCITASLVIIQRWYANVPRDGWFSVLLKDTSAGQLVANREIWARFSPAKGFSFFSVCYSAAEYHWTWRMLRTTRQCDTQWQDNKCNKYSCVSIMLMFNREVLVLLSDRFWLIVCQGRYSVSESDARRQGRIMNMMNPTLI